MDILFVATSAYNDPFAQEWHPDLRYTIFYLRRHQINAGYLYVPVLEQPEQLFVQNGKDLPDTIFIELTEENRVLVLPFLESYKYFSPKTTIIVGGIPANFSPQTLLGQHKQIDYVVTGEREFTLLEALRRIKRGEKLSDIRGFHSREFTNPPRPFISKLDLLDRMIQDGLSEMLAGRDPQERIAYLASSRGCYAHCSFCGVPDYYHQPKGQAWRGRSAKVVVEEIRELHNKFQILRFVFEDDEFFGPGHSGQERAQSIATEILRSKLQIQYFLCCRLNDIQPDTMALMKESGLSGIGLSVESTSQESLNLLQKGIKVESIYPTLQLLEEIEMPCQVNLIFFDPYITLHGVRSNLALLEYLRDSKFLSYSSAFPFNELKPFPWSRVAARLRAEGLLNESNDTCIFKDANVDRLVHFTRQIKERLPLTFKKRMLFDSLDSLSNQTKKNDRIDGLVQIASGLRHWVGLTLLPRYIGAACDVLERDGKDVGCGSWKLSLDELEQGFAVEANILHIFERNLRERLGEEAKSPETRAG